MGCPMDAPIDGQIAKVRSMYCKTCPFNRIMSKKEVTEVLENYPNHHPSLEVLCHTDGFIEGKEYSNCRGFFMNAERLKRLNLL